jgi:hypothetical protein
VAERLLAGDTLYSGVYDNKEPLFYYFVAGQLALGPWAEVAADALVIAIAAGAVYFTAVKLAASSSTAFAISLIVVPITLTGEFYYPGYTELPGIALVLVSIAASAYRQPALSGVCIGLLVFLKLIFVPVALVGVCCFPLAHRRFFDMIFIALGTSVSAVLIVGVLVARGELLPFIATIKPNIAYSQGNLIGSKGPASLVEHIRRVGGPSVVREVVSMLLAITLAVSSKSDEWSRMQLRDSRSMHLDSCRLASCTVDNRPLGPSRANPSYTGDHRSVKSNITPGCCC